MYLFLFLFLTLYMFQARRAYHQERQIVSTQPLQVQVGSSIPTCTRDGHRHRVTVTRGCVDTIYLS
jgi:hypothetical protein